MALETELRTFERHLEDLRQHHEGQFALIKGDTVEGTFTTFAEAYVAGVAAHGTQSFMVRQIKDHAPVHSPALNAGILFAG